MKQNSALSIVLLALASGSLLTGFSSLKQNMAASCMGKGEIRKWRWPLKQK